MIIGHAALSEELLLHFLHRNIAQSPGNRDSLEDIILHSASLAAFATLPALLLQLIHDLLQLRQLLAPLDAQGDDELEEVPIREDVHPLLAEEVVDVGDVPPQEVQRVRVVVLHRLRDVDHEDLPLVVEHVVLAEVGVDQLALLVEDAHDLDHLEVDLAPLFDRGDLGVLQPGGVLHVLADEVHDEHVGLDQQADGGDDDSLHALQVSQLLLGPHADHLPRVARAVPSAEPELPLDVSIPILEDQDGGFVDLDRVLFLGPCVDGVVDVGLLPRREAPVDFGHDFVVDQFEQYPAGSLVEDLLDGGAIGLVLYPFLLGQLLLLAGVYFVVDLVEVDLGVEFGVCVLVVGLEAPFSLCGLGWVLTG